MKNIFKLIILILIFTQSQNVFAEFRDVETSAIIGDIPVVEANKINKHLLLQKTLFRITIKNFMVWLENPKF